MGFYIAWFEVFQWSKGVILFELVLNLVGNGLDFVWKFEQHQLK